MVYVIASSTSAVAGTTGREDSRPRQSGESGGWLDNEGGGIGNEACVLSASSLRRIGRKSSTKKPRGESDRLSAIGGTWRVLSRLVFVFRSTAQAAGHEQPTISARQEGGRVAKPGSIFSRAKTPSGESESGLDKFRRVFKRSKSPVEVAAGGGSRTPVTSQVGRQINKLVDNLTREYEA